MLFVFVLFFGIGGTLFGLRNIRASITAPFAQNQGQSNALETNLAVATIDTDRDGLYDSDELGVYGTSPFLPDSDSDGVNDADEIEQGKDPNCPEGQTCSYVAPTTGEAAAGSAAANGGQSANQLRELLRQAGVAASVVDGLSDQALLEAYAKTQASLGAGAAPVQPTTPPSPVEIRKLLVENGVPQAEVDKLSDEQLLQAYADTQKQLAE